MFRHLPSPRVFRTAVVSVVIVAAASQIGSGFAAASGGSLSASTDDTRALQGSSQNDASQACAALGGTVALHEDGSFSNGDTSAGDVISWTIGQEMTDPYFPGGSDNYTGSTPIQDVSFSYPSSINVIGVVVKGGTDYNVYTGSSSLTNDYISPLVGSGNVAGISGFWVCVGSSTPITPTISTQQHSTATTAYDVVTLGGMTVGAPTGSVSFTIVNSQGSPVGAYTSSTSTFTAQGHGVYTAQSATATFATLGLAPGTYTFEATYTHGNAGNYATVSETSGTNESFTVGEITPTISTTPHPRGNTVSDGVTVSGAGGTATGYVDFSLYSAGGSLVGTQDSVALVNGAASSQNFSNLAAGSYYFIATYLGSATYASVVGGQEFFSIGLLTPLVLTTPQPSGSTAYDTVTVSGTGGTPTGSVNFTLYNASGGVVGSDNGVGLSGGSATSSTFTGLAVGSYYFVATYLGDTVYGSLTGGQESFSITKFTPTMSTTPNPSGTSASDVATVSGPAGQVTPTGTVTFTLFSGNYPNGSPVSSFGSPITSLSGGSATSPSVSDLTSGSYYFVVTYSGDTSYAPITPGSPEPFSIIAASPPTVTKVVTTVRVAGTSASDVATVSSPSGFPTGSVSFALYHGGCGTGTLVTRYASRGALRAGVATAASTGTLRPGSYYFIATYGGNGTFSASTGTCEPFVIVKVSPPKVPPYRIPAKAPHTGFGGGAQSSGGALRELGALMVALGLVGVVIAERRRRRA